MGQADDALGDGTGRLKHVTLSRSRDTQAGLPQTPIERLEMTYYNANESGGNEGDLKTVSIQKLKGTTWTTIKTEYYGYYTDTYSGTGTTPGYQHGLKFIVKPEGFRRLSEVADPFTAPDELVAQYADAYLEYTDTQGPSTQRRVTKTTTQAGRCTHEFAYETATHGQFDDYNHWQLKMTATRPDGSIKIKFSNHVQQEMLVDHWATPTIEADGRWIHYKTYHALYARITEDYSPASINMGASIIYSEAVADLDVKRHTSQGRVDVTTYHTTGDSAGYVQHQQVRQGTGEAAINVTSFDYGKQTLGGDFVIYVSKVTSYPNTTNTGKVETNYSLSFHSSTLQVNVKTTTLPQIPTEENGEGTSSGKPIYEIEETYDTQGRLTLVTDPFNSVAASPTKILTKYEYDEPTSGVIRLIEDYGTGRSHLQTDYRVNQVGCPIEVYGPSHDVDGVPVRSVNWTVYKDYETWSGNGSTTGTGDCTTAEYTIEGPVAINKMDYNGNVTDQISAVPQETGGRLCATDSFPQSTYAAWTQNEYDAGGALLSTGTYNTIASDCPCSNPAHFDKTTFEYDAFGQRVRTQAPGGTITRQVHDTRGNVTETYVGTQDAGATATVPDGYNAPGNNMAKTATNQYDNDNPVGGNGVLTKTVAHIEPDDPQNPIDTNDRVVDHTYDWRDRLLTTTNWIDRVSPTTVSTITRNTFDNQDRVTLVDEYNHSVNEAHRIRQSKTHYDKLGRVYQTERMAVPLATGAPYNPLKSNNWFDSSDRVVKSQPAGSDGYTKTVYDAVGRVEGTYFGYALATEDAWLVGDGDKIFEQTENEYDDAGNLIQAISYQRNVHASGDGELTTSNARVTYAGFWYDAVGRQIAQADYGTNSFDRDDVPSPPERSDDEDEDVLVTSFAYNDQGQQYETTDPAGMVVRTEYDAAGRVVRTIQNYVETPSGGMDENVVVETAYNADGQVSTLTAVNSTTGDQVTRYVYGTTTDDSGVARNDLLVAEIYPDAADPTDQVSFKHNRQGQVIERRDQNGTVRTFEFDGLGRPTADTVETVGTAVDGTFRRIETEYEIRGMVNKVTTFKDRGATTAANQIHRTYNDYEQLDTESQNHSSATGTPPEVGYDYDAPGTVNTTRMTKITYPNGRQLDIDYAATDDDKLSRVTSSKINGETNNAVEYTYFGAGSIAKVNYPEPAVSMTLAKATAPFYPGLDQFGRIVDMPWTKSTEGDIAHLNYGYDEADNRTYREDVAAQAANAKFDELYGYDGLNRLAAFNRGELDLVTDPDAPRIKTGDLTLRQTWALDATGNWSRFGQTDQTQATAALEQTRVHNTANEITAIGATVGNVWADLSHDRNGNMTTIPKPPNPTESFTGIYDAWNRLVKLTDDNNAGATVAVYIYDGLNRRIVDADPGGQSSLHRHFYYSSQWQVLEERVGASTDPDRQYVWGTRYIDDLVLRDRDTDANPDLDERLFALQDDDWNVIAIAETDGTVRERLAYTAYGVSVALNGDFTDPYTGVDFDWSYRYLGEVQDLTTSLYLFRTGTFNAEAGLFCNSVIFSPSAATYEEPDAGDIVSLDEYWASGGASPDAAFTYATRPYADAHQPDVSFTTPSSSDGPAAAFPGRCGIVLVSNKQHRSKKKGSKVRLRQKHEKAQKGGRATSKAKKKLLEQGKWKLRGKGAASRSPGFSRATRLTSRLPIRFAGGGIALVLAYPSTAWAAEPKRFDWRTDYPHPGRCECAVWRQKILVPAWWVGIFGAEPRYYGHPELVTEPVDFGVVTPDECKAHEGIVSESLLESHYDASIYEILYVTCALNGTYHGMPSQDMPPME